MQPIMQEPRDQLFCQHFEVCTELAECHCAMGDYAKAERCYNEAAKLCPERPEPHVGLGMLYFNMDLVRDARRAFERALELGRDNGDALTGLAGTYVKESEYDKAFELYIRALKSDPDNLVALLGLFRTSCLMGSFAKVIGYLEHYLNLHPGDASVLFCLAALYVKEGRSSLARETLERILSTDPANAEAKALLAQIISSDDDGGVN